MQKKLCTNSGTQTALHIIDKDTGKHFTQFEYNVYAAQIK